MEGFPAIQRKILTIWSSYYRTIDVGLLFALFTFQQFILDQDFVDKK